jgi:hypothetical protein
MSDAAASHSNALQFFVILSEAKNLKTYNNAQKILRFAQNDKKLQTIKM